MKMANVFAALLFLDSVVSPMLALGERPRDVQEAVNRAFEKIKDVDTSRWYWNGLERDSHYVASIVDERFIEDIIASAGDKKEIVLLNCGGGAGGWSQYILAELKKNKVLAESGKRVHILNVTGGKECEEQIVRDGNITLQWLNSVKIEDIDQELAARGLDITNKVDYLVAYRTMRELADPFGTLKKLYRLLTPGQGTLVATGFLFALDGEEDILGFPCNASTVLQSDEHKAVLFTANESGRAAGDFALVRRTDAQELGIALEYSGTVQKISSGYNCAAKVVTDFKAADPGSVTQGSDFLPSPTRRSGSNWYYCNKGDDRCKGFFEYLKSKNLLAGMKIAKKTESEV